MNSDIRKRIEDILKDGDRNDSTLIDEIKEIILSVELQNTVLRESISLRDLFNRTIDTIKNQQNNDIVINSGFAELDQVTGGFRKGELIVIGGRPAMGKTQLMVNLALNISKDNPVLYFSFDLTSYLLCTRFISSISKIEICNILNNNRKYEENVKLLETFAEYENHKVFFNDCARSSLLDMKKIIIDNIEKHNIRVVMIDYLQLMNSAIPKYNRDQELASICRELKKLASDFGICVILTSQLSRSVEYRGGAKYPVLSDLRESGAIEQDADKVIFIYRPEYYGFMEDENGVSTKGLVKLIIAKNRNGKTGEIKLIADENFTSFQDYGELTKKLKINPDRLEDLDLPY